jgi:catechol 2,3-dioxygenase-like lactoylglutathione lyase family enzyme
MEVLSSRILLRPADLGRSRRFYRDALGLAIYREFGSPEEPSVVFFLGQGLLEVSGPAADPAGDSVMIWLQVRDVHAEHERLAGAGVRILREPVAEPWGLTELWIEDPDGVRIVLVEVPADHPIRRDSRPLPQALCLRSGSLCPCRDQARKPPRWSQPPRGEKMWLWAMTLVTRQSSSPRPGRLRPPHLASGDSGWRRRPTRR